LAVRIVLLREHGGGELNLLMGRLKGRGWRMHTFEGFRSLLTGEVELKAEVLSPETYINVKSLGITLTDSPLLAHYILVPTPLHAR